MTVLTILSVEEEKQQCRWIGSHAASALQERRTSLRVCVPDPKSQGCSGCEDLHFHLEGDIRCKSLTPGHPCPFQPLSFPEKVGTVTWGSSISDLAKQHPHFSTMSSMGRIVSFHVSCWVPTMGPQDMAVLGDGLAGGEEGEMSWDGAFIGRGDQDTDTQRVDQVGHSEQTAEQACREVVGRSGLVSELGASGDLVTTSIT